MNSRRLRFEEAQIVTVPSVLAAAIVASHSAFQSSAEAGRAQAHSVAALDVRSKRLVIMVFPVARACPRAICRSLEQPAGGGNDGSGARSVASDAQSCADIIEARSPFTRSAGNGRAANRV